MKNNLIQIINVIVYERIYYDFPPTINKMCLNMIQYDQGCQEQDVLCNNCPIHLAAARKGGFNYIRIAVCELQSS